MPAPQPPSRGSPCTDRRIEARRLCRQRLAVLLTEGWANSGGPRLSRSCPELVGTRPSTDRPGEAGRRTLGSFARGVATASGLGCGERPDVNEVGDDREVGAVGGEQCAAVDSADFAI